MIVIEALVDMRDIVLLFIIVLPGSRVFTAKYRWRIISFERLSCLAVSNENTFLTVPLEIKSHTNESQGPKPGPPDTEFICSREATHLLFFPLAQHICCLFFKILI